MVNTVLYNIEITFWKTAIPLMRESPFIQTCIQRALPLIQQTLREKGLLHRKDWFKLMAIMIGLGCAGLVLGFAAGLIISIGS